MPTQALEDFDFSRSRVLGPGYSSDAENVGVETAPYWAQYRAFYAAGLQKARKHWAERYGCIEQLKKGERLRPVGLPGAGAPPAGLRCRVDLER